MCKKKCVKELCYFRRDEHLISVSVKFLFCRKSSWRTKRVLLCAWKISADIKGETVQFLGSITYTGKWEQRKKCHMNRNWVRAGLSWLRSELVVIPPKLESNDFTGVTSIYGSWGSIFYEGSRIYRSYASSVCCSRGCKSAHWSNCRAKGIQNLISQQGLSKVRVSLREWVMAEASWCLLGPHILQALIHTVHTIIVYFCKPSMLDCMLSWGKERNVKLESLLHVGDFLAGRSIEEVYCPPHKNTSGGKQKAGQIHTLVSAHHLCLSRDASPQTRLCSLWGAWRLKRQLTEPSRQMEGNAQTTTFAFTNSQGSNPMWQILGEGWQGTCSHKRELHLANPKATCSYLLVLTPEGIAFEMSASLGKQPEIA